ncbi:hypothetical protein LK09_08215 [Microbacterium mangrovi]|uniref:Uncharacterized protein n=2 Tax=Microbacterium mangrovi TaxID=1348253 RepID=A0A0B2AAR5_9MICO|nr:hypothetical protein LK09_08215 [Microbacterium mangrovi]
MVMLQQTDLAGMFWQALLNGAVGVWNMLLANPWLLVLLVGIIVARLVLEFTPRRRRRRR